MPLTLMDLQPQSCRYPTAPGFFCGDPRQSLSSYCPHHHALCWVKVRAKGSAPSKPFNLPAPKTKVTA